MQKGGENQKFTGTRAGTILDSMKEEVGSASTGIWDWINAKKGEVTEPYPHRHRHAESTSDGVAEPSEGGEGGHASSADGQQPRSRGIEATPVCPVSKQKASTCWCGEEASGSLVHIDQFFFEQ